VIVAGTGALRGYEDEPHVDLRVDDHRDPVGELSRVLSLHRAHCIMRSLRNRPAAEQVQVLTSLVDDHPDDPHLSAWLVSARQTL